MSIWWKNRFYQVVSCIRGQWKQSECGREHWLELTFFSWLSKLLTLKFTIFSFKNKYFTKNKILKFCKLLQICCYPVQICPARPNWPGLACHVSRYFWKGSWNFIIFYSRLLFTLFLSQIWHFQELNFLSAYWRVRYWMSCSWSKDGLNTVHYCPCKF